jgi:hypothetical protein
MALHEGACRGEIAAISQRPATFDGRRHLLDLSAAASEGDLIALVTKAVQARRTTPRRLLEAMSQRSRYRHRQPMADILGDVAAGTGSPLEMKYSHDVERRDGLPHGNRQQRRHGLPYLSDVGYDEFRVLVELDGRIGHECRAISRYEPR